MVLQMVKGGVEGSMGSMRGRGARGNLALSVGDSDHGRRQDTLLVVDTGPDCYTQERARRRQAGRRKKEARRGMRDFGGPFGRGVRGCM